MPIDGVLIFAAALFVAAASPGPAIAAIVSRAVARGPGGMLAFSAGIAVGDVVWLNAAVLGLAALAQTFGHLFEVVRYGGAAYLLFLAWKLWMGPAPTADGDEQPRDEHPARLFLGGLALTLGNPKTTIFYLALVPSLLDVRAIGPAALAELSVVVLLVLAIVFGAYVGAALRARRFLAEGRAVRLVNRVTGGVMAGAAAAIVAR